MYDRANRVRSRGDVCMAALRSPSGAGGAGPEEDLESSLDLLRRAQQGDGEALDRLFARYRPSLRRWATGRLPAWARTLVDTDDLVHDCLLRTLRRIDRFEPRHDGALQAYLRQVLANRIREEIRRVRRRPTFVDGADDLQADEPSPLERAVGSEHLERYEAALARLRAADREAIVLRLEMSYDYAALARALGKPTPNAARVAVMRALMRLGQELAGG
jgi:RNA polymerase sigma-70 factor (ECF subfamily)